jgi:hypothetical protein
MFARRNAQGHYTWNGVKLPSVTTVIGILGSHQLSMWHAKTAALEAARLVAEGRLDEAQDWQKVMSAPVRYRDYKGAVGSVFHHAMQTKVLHGLPDDLEGFCQSAAQKLGYGKDLDDGYRETLVSDAARLVRRGLDWLDQAKPKFLMVGLEAVVVSLSHGYAGTMDFVAKIDGKLVLGDWKTSNYLWQASVHHQMEAYANADFIGDTSTGEEYEMPSVEATMALHVLPDAPVKPYTFPRSAEVFDSFLAMRKVYGALNNMPKPSRAGKATNKKEEA